MESQSTSSEHVPPNPAKTLYALFSTILGPEKDFLILAGIYGIGISLLSLALPISVQMLINTVANTGLIAPLAVLSLTLFFLLLASGLLNALRYHLMEIFGRRFYARLVSEISLRAIYAENPFFNDVGKGPLFNRYFDVVIVQKTIPYLMIGGFTIVLQALVGFVVVSLYHPLFLLFNIVFILLIWLTWIIWGRSAIHAGIDLSHKKHQTAAWLEGLGASNGFFKSQRHIAYALDRSDAETFNYVDQHRRHFRRHFAQTVALFVIYAAASAILLGLGGWLVIQGQLTLGQLVAAELILSAVFAGVAQLGGYLVSFYDLCAAVEELSLFWDVAQEEPSGQYVSHSADASLVFENVRGAARGRPATFNLAIPSGAKIMARASGHGVQRLFSDLLRRHVEPKGGFISFGGADILSTEVHTLRQQIITINRPTLIEMPIREYLRLSNDNVSPERVLTVLRAVGLEHTIADLEDGLDTELFTTGWPLSITETIQLKVAAAVLAEPRVLILNQLLDVVPDRCFSQILEVLKSDPDLTLICFSNRERDLGFEKFLYLDNDRQVLVDGFGDFVELEANRVDQLQVTRPVLPSVKSPEASNTPSSMEKAEG
ncbi:MAG: ABC transporter ATP-binding protein [Pseudomonadota bacterium]